MEVSIKNQLAVPKEVLLPSAALDIQGVLCLKGCSAQQGERASLLQAAAAADRGDPPHCIHPHSGRGLPALSSPAAHSCGPAPPRDRPLLPDQAAGLAAPGCQVRHLHAGCVDAAGLYCPEHLWCARGYHVPVLTFFLTKLQAWPHQKVRSDACRATLCHFSKFVQPVPLL